MSDPMPLGDGVSEAAAAFAAWDMDDANDLDRLGFAFTVALEDLAYMAGRLADKVEETQLHESIAEYFHGATVDLRWVANNVADTLNRPLVLKR